MFIPFALYSFLLHSNQIQEEPLTCTYYARGVSPRDLHLCRFNSFTLDPIRVQREWDTRRGYFGGMCGVEREKSEMWYTARIWESRVVPGSPAQDENSELLEAWAIRAYFEKWMAVESVVRWLVPNLNLAFPAISQSSTGLGWERDPVLMAAIYDSLISPTK